MAQDKKLMAMAEKTSEQETQLAQKETKKTMHNLKTIVKAWASSQADHLKTKLYETEMNNLKISASPTQYTSTRLDSRQRTLAQSYPDTVKNENAQEASFELGGTRRVSVKKSYNVSVGLEVGTTVTVDAAIVEVEASVGLSAGFERAKEKTYEDEITKKLTLPIPGKHACDFTMNIYETPQISHFTTEVHVEGKVHYVFKDKLHYDYKNHTFSSSGNAHKKHDIPIAHIFHGLDKSQYPDLNFTVQGDKVLITLIGERITPQLEGEIQIGESKPLAAFKPVATLPESNTVNQTSTPPTNAGVRGNIGLAENNVIVGSIEVEIPSDIYEWEDKKYNRWIEVQEKMGAIKQKTNNIGIDGNVGTMLNTVVVGTGNKTDIISLRVNVPNTIDPIKNPDEFKAYIQKKAKEFAASNASGTSPQAHTTSTNTTTTTTTTSTLTSNQHASPLSQPKNSQPTEVSSTVVSNPADTEKKTLAH